MNRPTILAGLVVAGGVLCGASPATAEPATECPATATPWPGEGWVGRFWPDGQPTSLTAVVDGYWIVEVCVDTATGAPEVYPVDPAARQAVVAHSSGAPVEHYSLRKVTTPPTTTTSTTSTTTSSTTSSTTSTTAPTTSTTSPSTSTTQPTSTTTSVPGSSTSTTPPVTIPPGDRGELPDTGAGDWVWWVAALGVLLLAAGVVVTAARERWERRA